MHFFHRTKPRVFGIVDVGSDSIKALLFEVPPPKLRGVGRMVPVGQGPNGALLQQNSMSAAIRPIEKFVWDLPESYTGVRLARKIREGIFRMVQRLTRVPERIFIALGPTVAECGIRTWRMAPDKGISGKMLTRRDIRGMYHDLFTQETDLRRAVIVTPVELLVNGYPLAWQENWFSDAVLPRARVRDIAFRTLSLFMSVESGATFSEIQQALGGMPVEFIPMVVVQKEAIVKGLGARDAFIVDIGGNETALVSVRDGRFAHAAFIPYGTRRIAETFAKKSGYSFQESQAAVRQYGQALPGSSPGLPPKAAITDVAEELLPGAPGEREGGDRARESVVALPDGAAADCAAAWKTLFVAALGSFAAAGPLPTDLFLTGGGARLPAFRAAVQASDWMGSVSYATTPSLRVLEGASFFGGDTLGGYVMGPEDAGLAALMVYARVHRAMF